MRAVILFSVSLAMLGAAAAQGMSGADTCLCQESKSCHHCEHIVRTCSGSGNSTMCECLAQYEDCAAQNNCFPMEMSCEANKAKHDCPTVKCNRASLDQIQSPCYECYKKMDRFGVDIETKFWDHLNDTSAICMDMKEVFTCETQHGCTMDNHTLSRCMHFADRMNCTNNPCQADLEETCPCAESKTCHHCEHIVRTCARSGNSTMCECLAQYEDCAAQNNCFPMEMSCEANKAKHDCPTVKCNRATVSQIRSPCYECYNKMDRFVVDIENYRWDHLNDTSAICADMRSTFKCEHQHGCMMDNHTLSRCMQFGVRMNCSYDVCL